jgi:hypothetical protein
MANREGDFLVEINTTLRYFRLVVDGPSGNAGTTFLLAIRAVA